MNSESVLSGSHTSDFSKNNFAVMRQSISLEIAQFLFDYLLLREQRLVTLSKMKWKYLSEADGYIGDEAVPNAYLGYADSAMETVLQQLNPVISEATGLNLHSAYSYFRLYNLGDSLIRHKDRPSCEISATLCLGMDRGDAKSYWGIWLDKTGGQNVLGEEVILRPGDLLIYRGCNLEHWREPLQAKKHGQVFLHYTDKNGPFKDNCRYDGRPHLGLPSVSRSKARIEKIQRMERKLITKMSNK